MSVRVVARIRPLREGRKKEIEKDIILQTDANETKAKGSSLIRIPNPRNSAENFTFQFNSVYGQDATQQDIFDNEVSPTVKHLFNGLDVTFFAYGVTGSGKTHTMRGGHSLPDRGVIPRLLSSIFRKGKKMEKDSEGTKRVEVSMTYYEIYNDKVFDLFDRPENRKLAGLPIRDNSGKTVVVGLIERPCTSVQEFGMLYDTANINRHTESTQLNAHSSRSHAVLSVKLSQIFEDRTIFSSVSAIDLAGSEDNRRTENNKERLVESASINKSLFVLAQCIDAIGKKQSRIPYRESKMTRILSLGQNNGLTVMFLNLAPVRSFHLDTLSTLNVACRTKKIEVREIENEPIFKVQLKQGSASTAAGPSIHRQPLRPLPSAGNVGLTTASASKPKPARNFSVYSENGNAQRQSQSLKRPSDFMALGTASRPSKLVNSSNIRPLVKAKSQPSQSMSRENIEELVNRMVDEKLASKALQTSPSSKTQVAPLDREVQRRLEALEQRIEMNEDSRSEGLQFLLMAKQHQVRGEDASALRMYRLALPHFPQNEKLAQRMVALEERLASSGRLGNEKPPSVHSHSTGKVEQSSKSHPAPKQLRGSDDDPDYEEDELVSGLAEQAGHVDDDEYVTPQKRVKPKLKRFKVDVYRDNNANNSTTIPLEQMCKDGGEPTPRTRHLLNVINTRDVAQIRGLKGVGAKKAEAIVNLLCESDSFGRGADAKELGVRDLTKLGEMRGIGIKGLEVMRRGVSV